MCIYAIITMQWTLLHTRLTALCTRKEKLIWILLEQETVSGSGISWAICKSAHCSRQTTMPAPHRSVFYRPDALPAAQPTASKHWSGPYCLCESLFFLMGVSGWMFLLVLAHSGSPGQRAVKRLCVLNHYNRRPDISRNTLLITLRLFTYKSTSESVLQAVDHKWRKCIYFSEFV